MLYLGLGKKKRSGIAPRRKALLLLAGVICATASGQTSAPPDAAQTTPSATVAAAAQGGSISGTVKSGAIPLPGVAVTATNTLTGKKYATTTDITGAFSMTIPKNGRYVVKAELAAFATATQEVLINAAGLNGGKPVQVAQFGLELASRAAAEEAQQTASVSGAISRGLQSLNVQRGDLEASDASQGAGNAGAQLPSAVGGDAASSDSVTVSGAMGQTNGLAGVSEDDIRQRIQDAVQQAQRQGGATGDIANAVVGMLGGMMGPGGGGFGGGPGGFGGGAGRGGRGGGGGFRGFNPAQPHGNVFYQGGNAALNASNFSLTGVPTPKLGYSQNRFGLSFAGSPYIPGLFKANTKQFVFLNLTGQRNINPINLYGTVPTDLERTGDFSGQPQLYDPATGLPITGNNFQAAGLAISPQAAFLLNNYYPHANITPLAPQSYNYQTITTAGSNASTAAMRFVRNFGKSAGNGTGGNGGRRQSNAAPSLRQNINFNGSYSHSASDSRNIFLVLGGASEATNYGVTAGYTVGYGRLNNNASINWNRSHTIARNYFTNGPNGDALTPTGIYVPKPAIGADPGIYDGLPSITLSRFSGLTTSTPSDRVNQTISFSDFVSYSHKKHNMRFGVDIRRVHADSIGGTNALGRFTFTGYATQNPACASSTANCTQETSGGSSFADFLLGLPQQSAIQAGISKSYLRANVLDWYAQDDWRVAANWTLNFGLRYEYFSPYFSKFNQLVNLDHNADFTSVAAVQPNQSGAYSGKFPRTLVNPDKVLYSPRFGFAYRPKSKYLKETVIRGGYGINFNTGQYASIAQQLSFQPPFAVTQTNIAGQQGCGTLYSFTLESGANSSFNCSTAPVQNNYSANKNYRLGHVQTWNVDVQKTFPLGIVANLGYTGVKSGELDIVRAPNRTALGLLNTSAQAFNYEDSLGYSRFQGMNLNVRKRLQKGISLQASYLYGHSIDNASSIGGSGTVVAQNDLDLNAEEGNSSFDIRHKVSGNWVLELPFGPNRAFLAKGGFWSKALDGFSISGDYTFATGTYFTPQYNATIAETATGSNNSLRPNRNFAQPIHGANTVFSWFNPAAFTTPAAGQFGNASRNSIEGPGTVSVNSSLSRTLQLGSTRTLEFRATASNVFNTVQYSGIDTTLNSQTFGQVTSTASQRQITMIARYRF